MGPKRSSQAGIWLVVAIALLYMVSRAHNLTALPVFVDEANHMTWPREIQDLHVLYMANEGRVLSLWWWSLFWRAESAMWITRAATVLLGMVGLCATYGTMRALRSPRAGLVAALFHLFSTFYFFYERMALTESVAIPLGTLAICATVWAARSMRWREALLAGFSLALALMAKVTVIPLMVVPAAAAVALVQPRRGAQLAARIYGAFALVWVPFTALLALKGYNFFGLVGVHSASPGDTLLARFSSNLPVVWEQLTAYFSAPGMLLIAACALYFLFTRPRAGAYLVLVGAGPLFALLFLTRTLYGRYMLTLLPPLLMLLGGGLSALGRRVRLSAALPVGVLGVWVVFGALPFFAAAYAHPGDLPLSRDDRWQYIAGESSGFGRREAGHHLAEMAAQRGETVHALGLIVSCKSIRLMLDAGETVALECPRMAWDGALQQHYEELIAQLAAQHSPFYLLEEDLPYIDLESLPVALTLVETFPRPGANGRPINLWRAAPLP